MICNLLLQRIVFDSLADLASAVQAIAADESVDVAHVRNDLDPGRPLRPLAGGYRGVIIRLRLCTPDTRRLGLDDHICEVSRPQP